jgi:orotidine-5'-phosphate decarboxylase
MLTIHASGGAAMMEAARDAAGKRRNHTKLLAVTVLTSMNSLQLKQGGVGRSPKDQVLHLARMARDAGMDGVITSPLEVATVRKACGPNFLIVVPGIRPAPLTPFKSFSRSSSSRTKRPASDDQSRIATPAAALLAGADYLVIGRPILDASDPVAAADAILREMDSATRALKSGNNSITARQT